MIANHNLLSILDTHIGSYCNINPIVFSKKSKQLLYILLSKIGIAHHKWNQSKKSIFNHIDSNDYVAEKDDIAYFPKTIRTELTKDKYREHTFHFRIHKRDIAVIIVSYETSIETIQDIVCKIYTWLTVASEYADNECSNILTVRIYLTKHLKQIPISKEIEIDREHVNSAYTYACRKTNTIHVYRSEEWFKVFIHETFHAFGLDFAKQNNDNVEEFMRNMFNTNDSIRCYEAYCEIWATLINSLFISYINTPFENNIVKWTKNVVKMTVEMLEYERMFSIYQCYKILDHKRISYGNLFQEHMQDVPISSHKYTERTHVLSYHFIKCSMIWNMELFVCWCADMNEYSIRFNDKEYERVSVDFCKQISKYLRDPLFVHCLQGSADRVSEIKNALPELAATLRMTLYG